MILIQVIDTPPPLPTPTPFVLYDKLENLGFEVILVYLFACLLFVVLLTVGYQKQKRHATTKTPTITSLSHAGFIYEYDGLKILIDPWVYPAFAASWFPYPKNKRYILNTFARTQFDVLYISHTHEDHLDRRLLALLPNIDTIQVLCADFTSGHLEKELRQLGFKHLSVLKHQQSIQLTSDLIATMILDVSFKEDSALLLDAGNGTHRFLNLNDCNTRAEEHPKNITVLALQFSGAQWFPDCYEMYAVNGTYEHHVDHILDGLERNLLIKIRATDAKEILPSAGVHCFLDPSIEGNNIRRFNRINRKSIFPRWEKFAERMNFAKQCPGLNVLRFYSPGDVVKYNAVKKRSFVEFICNPNEVAKRPTEQILEQYYQERQDEIHAYMQASYSKVTTQELRAYMLRLHHTNQNMIVQTKWKKKLRIGVLGKDGGIVQSWGCRVGDLTCTGTSMHTNMNMNTNKNIESSAVIVFDMDNEEESELHFVEEYSFDLSGRLLRDIVDDKMSWEDAFASMRVKLSRSPDIYDTAFMICLRYGTKAPRVCDKYVEQQKEQGDEGKNVEMIELPGLPPGATIQRYCPHQGADLKQSTVVNGVITCHRHGWTFCAESGKCLSGGNQDLRMRKLEW